MVWARCRRLTIGLADDVKILKGGDGMSARRILLPLLGAAAGFGLGLALGRGRSSRTRSPHPVLEGAPLLIAHRGGAALVPENTLEAFDDAVNTWGSDMIELDVHATADGHCVVIHDPTVDRTTNGTGAVSEMTLDELQRLDAGYRFTPDGGVTYPYRSRGVRVPTLDQVLDAFPDMRFTVEVKTPSAQRPLFEAVRRAGAQDRIIAASQHDRQRTLFGTYSGPISSSAEQLRAYWPFHAARLGFLYAPDVEVVQLPEHWNGQRVLTPRLVDDLHGHGIHVHVWTVDAPEDMERLLDWQVDGIMTDRPDRLAEVLHRRVARPLPDAL